VGSEEISGLMVRVERVAQMLDSEVRAPMPLARLLGGERWTELDEP
jgi:hypothetical protein